MKCPITVRIESGNEEIVYADFCYAVIGALSTDLNSQGGHLLAIPKHAESK